MLTLKSSRYRDQAHYNFTHRRRQSLYAMPQRHWQLLSGAPFNILETLNEIDEAIDKNAEIAEAIVQSGLIFASLDPFTADEGPSQASFVTKANRATQKPVWQGQINSIDQEKAHGTIRQLYRDWSAEGQSERDACYEPVLSALDKEFCKLTEAEKGNTKILVPGAGLGRSVFEIGIRGYAVEGNEISYHQIMASNHVMNHTTHAGQYELYPWAHDFSNHLTRAHQLQRILIPDVHPATAMAVADVDKTIPLSERMSFSSADFCVEYNKEEYNGAFDAVTSIFFIDTAPNVIRYVETVHNCLRDGGIWINLGPLKWHFENDPPGSRNKQNGNDSKIPTSMNSMDDQGIAEPGSVELTNEEVIALVESCGFVVEKQEVMRLETGYIGNSNSMWRGTYYPSFWIARKRQH
jgi:carnosine N-methyltransferase